MTSTIILDLPFGYAIRHTPPRCRNATKTTVKGFAPVQLRVLSGEEAPVALRIRHTDWVRRHPDSYQDGAPVEELRVIDGELFYRPSEGLTAERFQDDVADGRKWRGYSFVRQEGRPAWSASSYPLSTGFSDDFMKLPTPEELVEQNRIGRFGALKPAKPLNIESDTRADEAAKAVALLSKAVVVIDGEVWFSHRKWDPHYTVHHRDNTFGGTVPSVEVTFSKSLEKHAWSNAFRVDRLDEARAFAASLAAQHGIEVKENLPEVDVLIRAPLGDDMHRVAAQISSAVRDNHHNDLDEASPFGRLVASSKAWRLGSDRSSAGSLIAAAMDFRQSLGEDAECEDSSQARVAEQLELPLQRWGDMERNRHPELEGLRREREADMLAIGFM